MDNIIKMNSIPAIRKYKNTELIHPGPVGSIGDPLISSRLKSSLAGNFNWDAEYYGQREPLFGSSISDGTRVSFNSGGGPARVNDSNWNGSRSFNTNHGYYYQDMVAPDKLVMPEQSSLPQYQWRNKIAEVRDAKRTGTLFLPLPQIDAPEGVPRGGAVPRVTDVAGENTIPGYDETPFQPNFHPHLSTNYNESQVFLGTNQRMRMTSGITTGRINRS